MKANFHIKTTLRDIVTKSILSGLWMVVVIQASEAGSATWKANPASGDWNQATNWTPRTVPNRVSDIATFNSSSVTDISFSSGATVGGIIFNPGASLFSISVYGPNIPNLMIFGSGVTNNSGITQQIVVSKDATSMGNGVYFNGSALAGVDVVYTNNGGLMNFLDSSSADQATIISDGNANAFGGVIEFFATSTAGRATVINNGALPASPNSAGLLYFLENSTAGGALITTNGGVGAGSIGAQTQFDAFSNATNAVLVANAGVDGGLGGRIFFLTHGDGGTSRVELFGNGALDMSNQFLDQVTIGSLEGDGLAFLGGGNLTVGSNNLTTTFAGVIQDGGFHGGSGASLTKTGTGALTLAGASTYTGGTTVSSGALVVTNSAGSATGTGAVTVNAGSLSGGGIIAGAVTMGTGSGPGAFLAPATGKVQATLTIQNILILNSDSTYTCMFKAKRNNVRTDLVIANGVTINSGAKINLHGSVRGSLRQGLTLTLISNTAANPISGTFDNLPDGAIVTVNGNNLQVTYEGGDGNDLTLTVQ